MTCFKEHVEKIQRDGLAIEDAATGEVVDLPPRRQHGPGVRATAPMFS